MLRRAPAAPTPPRLRLLAVLAPAVALGGTDSARGAPAGSAVALAPTSSPGLLFGVDSRPSVGALAIERSSSTSPRVLYSVRVAGLSARPATIDVRATTQLLRCRGADIRGTRRRGPCTGTTPYAADPRFSWKIVLAERSTATTGRLVQGWRSVVCRDAVHHCPVPARADGFRLPPGTRFVNLVAAAHSPSAGRGQVVGISHGAMQVIQARSPRPRPRPTVSGPLATSFPVSPGSARAGRADLRPALLFSQPVQVRRGDVLDVTARFRLTIHGSRDNAPSTVTFVFLGRAPANATGGGPSLFRRAGENCPTTCALVRLGAIRAPASGRMYVNVVAFAQDHEHVTSATVSVQGTLSVARR